MRKYKLPPKVHRKDKRCGDDYIREWAKALGSVREAERQSNIYRGNLHNWLIEPERGFTPGVMLKVATAAACPVEAILYRFTPIKDLPMWKFMEAEK